jgi:hypothetical protein
VKHKHMGVVMLAVLGVIGWFIYKKVKGTPGSAPATSASTSGLYSQVG